MRVITYLMTALLLLTSGCATGQRADPAFDPTLVVVPAFQQDEGPVIWIDEGHNNIVATRGRYLPFIKVLKADGYRVRPLRSRIHHGTLIDINTLVIGNALHRDNVRDWSLPTPSAFSPDEIRALVTWVSDGGSLLLLTDHMPFAGAMKELALGFGFELSNGFVFDPDTWDPVIFSRVQGSLIDHPITRGRSEVEVVASVASFFGAAFIAEDAEPLLVLDSSNVSYEPSIACVIDDATPFIPVGGWLQAAARTVGKGRIVFFSDATMFSAQIGVPDPNGMGMNTSEGRENLQLLLNTMHWLTGLPDN